jgi:hypothetical protein
LVFKENIKTLSQKGLIGMKLESPSRVVGFPLS